MWYAAAAHHTQCEVHAVAMVARATRHPGTSQYHGFPHKRLIPPWVVTRCLTVSLYAVAMAAATGHVMAWVPVTTR